MYMDFSVSLCYRIMWRFQGLVLFPRLSLRAWRLAHTRRSKSPVDRQFFIRSEEAVASCEAGRIHLLSWLHGQASIQGVVASPPQPLSGLLLSLPLEI